MGDNPTIIVFLFVFLKVFGAIVAQGFHNSLLQKL